MKRPVDALPAVLDHLDEFETRLAGRRPVVFLDFDGTLAAIADRPDQVALSASMRETLRRLAQRVRVAVVSGRDRDDVESLVGIEGIVYAGNHGFDIAGGGVPGFAHRVGQDHVELMEAIGERLSAELADVPGVLIELKRVSIAVHFRNVAKNDVAAVERAVADFRAAHPKFRVMSGRKVFEILPPVEWDKGRAVLWLLEVLELDSPDVVPIYIGDDVTDEDAFEALLGRGIGICVADGAQERGPTAADFRVRDSAEVERFLAGLA